MRKALSLLAGPFRRPIGTGGRGWLLAASLTCVAFTCMALSASAQSSAPAQGSAGEDQLVVSRPWARLRSQPAETGRAVALVYGNDVLTVLERKDGWLKVRSAAQTVGWLAPQDAAAAPASRNAGGADGSAPPVASGATASTAPAGAAAASGQDPSASPRDAGRTAAAPGATNLPALPAPRGSNPASADTLRRMGYDEAARRKLTDTLLHEQDTPAAYQATRDMLTYHPVGGLPPLQGNAIPPEARDSARVLRVSVLLQEGQTLVQEKKPWDAVLLYQAMVQGDPGNGRAFIELLDLLTRYMEQSAGTPGMENLGLAISLYRKNFPDLPLPPAVEARVRDKK